jgi:hypothetical protein
VLSVGAFVGGELPVMDALFPSPFIAFIFYLLLFLSFYFKVQPEDTALAW